MDASAYLRRQGWRGDGHSLDHTNRGIKKPLLVSKKVDVLGLGLDKHAAVSDQWWLRAFDQGLKNLGNGQQSALSQIQKHGVHRGGLYAGFVKGEKLEGSLLPTPEDSTAGTNTPVSIEKEEHRNMGIDIPPVEALERVVGSGEDKNARDAMMYLLQNPDEAPASTRKVLDKKRKRAEAPQEKRARRKMQQAEQAKEHASMRNQQAIEDGTVDVEAEEERRKMEEIDRRANSLVVEAQRMGILPLGPNETRKGIAPTGANGVAVAGQGPDSIDPDMQQVCSYAGLDPQVKFQGSLKGSLKAQKAVREKAKREFKRAAKAYLISEPHPDQSTPQTKHESTGKKKALAAQKKADRAKKDAERIAKREEKAATRREKRARQKVQRAEINRLIAERKTAQNGAETGEEGVEPGEGGVEMSEEGVESGDEAVEDDDLAGQTGEEAYALRRAMTTSAKANGECSDGFVDGADEIKLGPRQTHIKKARLRKIPGVGLVERYPTPAEKRAKKIATTAIMERITEEEVKARFAAEKAQREADERGKSDKYRAMKRGMNLEQYREGIAMGEMFPPKIERKGIPSDKLAEYKKRADKKGLSLEEYIRRRGQKKAAKVVAKMSNPRQLVQNGHTDATVDDAQQDIGFVVDTAGDDTLQDAPKMPVDLPPGPIDLKGMKVKDLPKHLRKARRDRMRLDREEKKRKKNEAAIAAGRKPDAPKKSKGQRKVEAREVLAKQILFQSRQHFKKTGSASGKGGTTTIDGIADVPLVKVESKSGLYSKNELSLARSVARRVLKKAKKDAEGA